MKIGLAGVALVAVALISLGAAPSEDDPRCHGRLAKIVGTDEDDKLRGTPKRDVIWGGLGDDEIVASLGNDLVCGGPGADLLHGGRGNDTVDGGAGHADIVVGDLGDDELFGGPGNGDEVAGSLGIDVINGGPGSNDLVHGDYGYDRIDGGAGGGDTVSFATDVASDKGAGVWVSLPAHKARGDGHDRIFRSESIEGSAFRDILIGDPRGNAIDGGPGDDKIFGGRGSNRLEGGQGKDGCKGGPVRSSCGRERAPNGSSYVELDRTPGGGGGLLIVGGGGADDITIAFEDHAAFEDEVITAPPAAPQGQAVNNVPVAYAGRSAGGAVFALTAAKGIALGPGCVRPGEDVKQAVCAVKDQARWLMADLGPGNDKFRVEGSLAGAQNVRIAGGPGNDTIRGGPEDDLIEAGEGADRLYGEAGADGLIGGLPGPTFLYGGQHGDLLAAGGGCAGGAIVGGPGRDDASFAETQAHPGLLIISFPQNKAWIDAVHGCKPVALADSNEDMEGSFDYDVLIGDGGPNAMLGQPGKDEFYGGGGDDIVDARDGVRDTVIQCGAGTYVQPRRKPGAKGPPPEPVLRGTPAGRALIDSFDPPTLLCAARVFGTPVKGLNNSG